LRGPVAAGMVKQLHNIIQNSFYRELKIKYSKDVITLEYKKRIDIVRETADTLYFYEIKPFENVPACLRQAIGQLIEYAHLFSDTSKQIKLIIVGPGEARGDASVYLQHYQDIVRIPLSYEQHIASNRRAEMDK
jgi:hypothetical protein